MMPNRRVANLLGGAACAAMMAYALYAEHILGLMPCPLCVFQRIAVIALGAVFLIAAAHDAGRPFNRVYAALMLLCGGAGIGVAGRHVYLQSLPPEELPSCGPGLNFLLDTLPLGEVFSVVLTGSGECGTIDWVFLGLSMPAWVLIALVALVVWGIFANFRPATAQAQR